MATAAAAVVTHLSVPSSCHYWIGTRRSLKQHVDQCTLACVFVGVLRGWVRLVAFPLKCGKNHFVVQSGRVLLVSVGESF